MKISNTKIILEGCINQYKIDNEIGLNEVNVFEVFSSAQILKSYNLTYDEIFSTIVGSSSDGGIDCFASFINNDYIRSIDEISGLKVQPNGVLELYVCQYKKEKSFKEGAIDKLIATMSLVFALDKQEPYLMRRFNDDLVGKIMAFRDLWKKTISNGGNVIVKYFYATVADDQQTNAAFRSKVDQLIDITKANLTSKDISLVLLDAPNMLDLFQKKKSNLLPLIFKDRPASTTYEKNGGVGYVGIVRLQDYYKFITDENNQIREELFESNIRHYRGEVDVNNRIKSSLEGEIERDFWWLNNGITIIADKVQQVDKELFVENVQIVNGLQTSYTIGGYYKDDIDPRSVLVKIIVSQDRETIDKIISSTNSQNPVSPDLLRATEDIQREIETFFLDKGYFYDRRRNFYKNIGKPLRRIFSIQYTAQCIESILFNGPHIARSRPTELTKEPSKYNRIFDKNVDFNSFLNCCLIMQQTFDFWMDMPDNTEKKLTVNFKIHLARIASSVVLNKANYSSNDIAKFNVSKYNQELFNKAVNSLVMIIEEYQIAHPGDNIANISKTKLFTDLIIQRLNKIYA